MAFADWGGCYEGAGELVSDVCEGRWEEGLGYLRRRRAARERGFDARYMLMDSGCSLGRI